MYACAYVCVCMVYTCDIGGWNGNQLAPHLVPYLYSAGFHTEREALGCFPQRQISPYSALRPVVSWLF